MKGRYLVSTGLGGEPAMMDRVAVQTMVSYWSAQWIRVCEENVFCQDNVAPEFLFQSQHLLGCNPHCSTAGIQTPAPQTKTTVSPISDKSARSQQARHSLKMQEWTFPIIHKVLPCQHLQQILKLKGMAGFHQVNYVLAVTERGRGGSYSQTSNLNRTLKCDSLTARTEPHSQDFRNAHK